MESRKELLKEYSGTGKPLSRKRLLRVNGKKHGLRRNRFNEDAESVAKSVREEQS